MSIGDFERNLINYFSQLEQLDNRKKNDQIIHSLDMIVAGFQERPNFKPKLKFQLDDNTVVGIRFVNKEFKADLQKLANDLQTISQHDQRLGKYDEVINRMRHQVNSGNVIYQVGQKAEKTLATGSQSARAAYQEQRRPDKPPIEVHMISEQTQNTLATKIGSRVLQFLTTSPLSKAQAPKPTAKSPAPTMSSRQEKRAPTEPTPTSPQARRSPQEPRPSPQQPQQRTTASQTLQAQEKAQRAEKRSAAEEKSEIEKADQTRRKETKRTEGRTGK